MAKLGWGVTLTVVTGSLSVIIVQHNADGLSEWEVAGSVVMKPTQRSDGYERTSSSAMRYRDHQPCRTLIPPSYPHPMSLLSLLGSKLLIVRR